MTRRSPDGAGTACATWVSGPERDHTAEETFGRLDDPRALHLAADGQHHTVGPIDRAIVREQVVPRQPLDALLRSEMAPTVRMAAVDLTKQRVEAQREGRVGSGLDLTEKEATLLLDFVRPQRRLKGDLRDERQELFPVNRQRLAAHLRGLDLAIRVEAAADVFGADGELHRRAPERAAHHGAVKEVGDAGRRFGLEARAGADLQRDGDDADRGVLAHQHLQPVRKDVRRDRCVLGLDAAGREHESEERPARAATPRVHRDGGTNASRS